MESDQTNTVSSSDGLSQGIHRMRDLNGRTTGPTRRSTKGQWTVEEDEILCKAVQRFQGKNWKKIAECFKDRTDVQCLHRWQKVLNPDLVKGPWTKEEDEVLVRLVEQIGPKKWSSIAQQLPGRIGKQCRERWHNHLNPAISKESWTQEEELMLIQAHKVYGNKWAELTKFLPGRTDNAIKNHWNSSVKKKLDAYLASGLLDKFQGLPCVSHTNQSTPTSSRTQQCSGDGSIHKDIAEVEEISECSQGSNLVRCLQTNNDITKTNVVDEEDEDQPDKAKTFIVDVGDNTQSSENLNHGNIPGCSQESSLPCNLRGESELMYCEDVDQDLEAVTNQIQCSVGFTVSNSVRNDGDFDMEAQILTSEDNCSKVIQPADGTSDSLFYQEPECQSPNADASNLQSKYQSICTPSQLPSCTSDAVSNQFNGLSVGNQEFPELSQDGLIYSNDSRNFHSYNNQDIVGSHIEIDQATDSLKQISVDSFSVHSSVDENLVLQTQKQEPGLLSYNPPRFPSLDIPFLSCDLIQSNGDLQDEFSPLGIRQLMMTSTNCFSPCRLWESPSRVDSPEAVLKSAAKAFTGAPSILKKRNCDFLSPLSEKRCGKKLESTKDFSKGNTVFDENKNKQLPSSNQTEYCGPFIEDKENLNPADDIVQREGGNNTTVNVQQPPAVLMEQNLDDLIFSCNRIATNLDTPKGPHAKTPRKVSSKFSGAMSDQATVIAASSENPCHSLVSPHTSRKRNNSGIRFSTSVLAAASSSVPAEVPANDVLNENLSISGETPFKKSLESPSAWMSPWFSLMPGPTVDTNITIEDIGYFSSPGESYDALGLMKHLSEHTASAYANAREILGDETPDSMLKKRLSEKGEWSWKDLNVKIERRVLDFSDCGSPRKGEQSTRPAPGVSSSSPSSYLLKSCR